MYYGLGKQKFGFLIASVVLLAILSLALTGCSKKDDQPQPEGTPPAKAPSASQTEFAMEEFSVFDEEFRQSPAGYQLTSGQAADEAGIEPFDAINAYPKLKSEYPIYGKITFGCYIFDTSDNFTRHFIIDESKGPDTGYDKLYFDRNGDLDLTNDAPVAGADESPTGRKQPNETYFKTLEFSAKTPKGRQTDFQLIARLISMNQTTHRVSFITPTARRGKITIGDQELDAKLVQSITIAGRYDSPTTVLILDDENSSIPFVSATRKSGDTLYTLSTNAKGDKLLIEPYKGDFGKFKPEGEDAKITKGFLMSADSIIDIADCPEEDGYRIIPVGDYRPLQLAAETKDLRYAVSSDIAPPGQEVSTPVAYEIKITKDKPFSLKMGKKAEVQFKSPPENQRYRPGQPVQVSAMMYEPTMGLMLSSLDDKSKPQGDAVKMHDGTMWQMYHSIDPQVKIVDSAGKTVAEGKMPFG